MNRLAVRGTRLALVLVGAACGSGCSDGPTGVPPEGSIDLTQPWRVADPDAVGLNGAELDTAGELAGSIERMRSLLVVRDGRLAFERYYGGWTADSLADVRSVTKSVVSVLAGIAIARGHLDSVDRPITDYVPARYALRPEHSSVTVRHLLTMTGGFDWTEVGGTGYEEWIVASDQIQYLLDRELIDAPGSTFRYNSAAVHLLGVVLEDATGMPLPRYADRVLFEPLSIGRRAWEPSSGSHVNGGSGLDLRPRDLARLGQLMLQDGWSDRRPVVPSGWVVQATSPRTDWEGRTGPVDRLSYGYLWWLDLDRDAFFARGYGGQTVYVSRPLGMVVVATTDWRGVEGDVGSASLQAEVLELIVGRILPAVR